MARQIAQVPQTRHRTWIALFRGINVGGRHSLPMAGLRELLAQNGCSQVRTYIQSGNAVFSCRETSAAKLARRIQAVVAKRFGFEPRVMVLSDAELEQAAAGNPYKQAVRTEPKFVHLYFLDAAPERARLEALEAVRHESESFALAGRVLYLHTPKGYGISKLAERAERLLGVTATARNWRTVSELLNIARTQDDPERVTSRPSRSPRRK
ncbi:MAG TPA: DUF1697 domain-containing protein [Steroidobacteraceae bacterium]|nr:DUF1697 domain-containing protein [Steroidobacteraceae bacterium]